MQFIIIGCSFKTAPLDVRERLAYPPDEAGAAAARLLQASSLREAVVLGTCNRLEIYAAAPDVARASAEILAFLAAERGLEPEVLARHHYRLSCEDAVNHLFRVTAGLESQQLGESEILAQVRRAFAGARAHHATGALLNELFMQAAEVGKRVRAETGIARGHASLATTVAEVLAETFPELEHTTVLVVGAGQISERVVRLLSKRRVGRVVVMNRTEAKAEALAVRYGAASQPLSALREALPQADAVIFGTAAGCCLLGPADLQHALGGRARPLVCIDISLPRNIHPAVAAQPGVVCYDLETLQARIGRCLGDRERSIVQAEALIQQQMAEFLQWLNGLDAAPTISALHGLFETVRTAELERLRGRWSTPLSEHDQEVLESLTRGIVNKVLHGPIMRLKQTADAAQRREQLAAAAVLFGLDPEALAAYDGPRQQGARRCPVTGAGASAPQPAAAGVLPR